VGLRRGGKSGALKSTIRPSKNTHTRRSGRSLPINLHPSLEEGIGAETISKNKRGGKENRGGGRLKKKARARMKGGERESKTRSVIIPWTSMALGRIYTAHYVLLWGLDS